MTGKETDTNDVKDRKEANLDCKAANWNKKGQIDTGNIQSSKKFVKVDHKTPNKSLNRRPVSDFFFKFCKFLRLFWLFLFQFVSFSLNAQHKSSVRNTSIVDTMQ